MITTILRNATRQQLEAAYHYTADHLHIPVSELTDTVAVAYVASTSSRVPTRGGTASPTC